MRILKQKKEGRERKAGDEIDINDANFQEIAPTEQLSRRHVFQQNDIFVIKKIQNTNGETISSIPKESSIINREETVLARTAAKILSGVQRLIFYIQKYGGTAMGIDYYESTRSKTVNDIVDNWEGASPVIPYVIFLLEELDPSGIKYAVASGGSPDMKLRRIGAFGLSKHFRR